MKIKIIFFLAAIVALLSACGSGRITIDSGNVQAAPAENRFGTTSGGATSTGGVYKAHQVLGGSLQSGKRSDSSGLYEQK
ncbi:MAG: hypothetical protein ABH871_00010 [Pseudomonadota bacterium]